MRIFHRGREITLRTSLATPYKSSDIDDWSSNEPRYLLRSRLPRSYPQISFSTQDEKFIKDTTDLIHAESMGELAKIIDRISAIIGPRDDTEYQYSPAVLISSYIIESVKFEITPYSGSHNITPKFTARLISQPVLFDNSELIRGLAIWESLLDDDYYNELYLEWLKKHNLTHLNQEHLSHV